MIFIGDLAQLPPVLTTEDRQIYDKTYPSPYFFDANVILNKNNPLFPFEMEFIELDKIFRQKDPNFINILNAVRDNNVSTEHLAKLNNRHIPYFEPNVDKMYVYLATTNYTVDSINIQALSQLSGELFHHTGEVLGKFSNSSLPTELELNLKIDAQVMFTNNERDEDGGFIWVNGTMGIVTEIEKIEGSKKKIITVKLPDGTIRYVLPHTWKNVELYFNEATKQNDRKEVGSFTQYPLKLAWAVTIHKAQGKTFDKVIIDVGRGTFAHGQMYVALSRATSLEGIVLARKLKLVDIKVDSRITKFVKTLKEKV